MLLNPCAMCKDPETVRTVAANLERERATMAATSEAMLVDASEAIKAMEETASPWSGATPKEVAEADQEQEFLLNVTSRMTRVSGEVRELIGQTLTAAALVQCGDAVTVCPRLAFIGSKLPELEALLEELHRPVPD
ncbi:MAG TPA: hypothetical protein VLG37_04650 [Candidatus Saccharimonadales bacterium]|nr:hypothetical protein [Candidatus Saccharimonadales bacterium]